MEQEKKSRFSGKVYCIVSMINNQKYYVCDLDGTLSHRPSDAMVFMSEKSADIWQGWFERIFENITAACSRMHVESFSVSEFMRWI